MHGSRVYLLNLVIHYQTDLTDYQKSTNPTTPSDLLSFFCRSPTYNLASFYNDVIWNNIIPPISRVKKNFEFEEKIKNLQVQPDQKMISLDAVPHFTNVQIGTVIKGIKERWPQIQPHTKIPWYQFANGLRVLI